MIVAKQQRRQGLYEEDTADGDSVRVACKITVIVVNHLFFSFSLALRSAERAHTMNVFT